MTYEVLERGFYRRLVEGGDGRVEMRGSNPTGTENEMRIRGRV